MRLKQFSPALQQGAKIYPDDIAGMIGLPYVGDIYYVDPTNGTDTNGGRAQNDALKTLSAAYAKTTNNHHDVIIIVPGGTGSGTGTVETAAITWSNSLTHLIGSCAPAMLSSRARVTTATAGLSPFITISGSGCIFKNVQFQSSAATDYITVRVSGNRNYFENVHFANINSTAAANAGFASLELYGAQENYFNNCTVGADTVTISSTGANLRMVLGSDTVARNIFDSCVFPHYESGGGSFFIKQPDTDGIDRWNLFRGCQFINASSSGSATMTDAISMASIPGGMLVLQDCLKIGATGWVDNASNIYLLSVSSNATYNQGIGFAVNPAA